MSVMHAATHVLLGLADTRALVPVSPVVLVVAVLLAAALCFALGTLRGSWRTWLVGYALAVVALVLAYGGVLRERRAASPASAPAPAARAPAPSTPRSAEVPR